MFKSMFRIVALSFFFITGTLSTRAAEIVISCSSVGVEYELCRDSAERWAKRTHNTVKAIASSNLTTVRFENYQEILSKRSPNIDVFQIDIVWTGALAEHFIDLRPYSKGIEKKHFEAAVANNMIHGRLIAMPWFNDTGLLYYRKDLLEKYGFEAPRTWEELTLQATYVQAHERAAGVKDFWGFVFQGKSYEGLTCNFVEWIDSFNGSLIRKNGNVQINVPENLKALTLASSWINTISPKDVLEYTEEETRMAFQSGKALFMRNWPYAWVLGNSENSPIRHKIDIAPLPKGGVDGKNTGVLGGGSLAVSKYSRHPKEAASLVMYLTSQAEQKRRTFGSSFNPTIYDLYTDLDVLQVSPFFGSLYETFLNATTRPSAVTGHAYAKVSKAITKNIHAALAGKISPNDALKSLQNEINAIKKKEAW